MIKRIVKLTFHPQHTDTFLAVFEESKEQIRHFPGCLHLELLRNTEPDNIFFTYSFWESEAALERYRKSDTFRSTWKRTKVLFAERPEAWSVVAVSG